MGFSVVGFADATVLLRVLLARGPMVFLVAKGFLAIVDVGLVLRGADAGGGAIAFALLVAAPPSSSSRGLLPAAMAELVALDILPGAASLDGLANPLRGVGMLLIFNVFPHNLFSSMSCRPKNTAASTDEPKFEFSLLWPLIG